MFVFRDLEKLAYISWVHVQVDQDRAARGALPGDMDRATRKLFIYAFSLPFWAAEPELLDGVGFVQLLQFVNAQDIVVAPQSMHDAFQAQRLLVRNIV